MSKFYLIVVAALALGLQAVKGQVVGGDDADINEFPYQVFLKYNDKYYASGVLISHNLVLTCGHCVERPQSISNLTAIVGTNNIESGGISVSIVHRLPHPRYRNLPAYADMWMFEIGIFTLGSCVTLSESIKIGKIPLGNEVVIQSNAVVSALGRRSITEQISPILQKLTVRIISKEECKEKMKPYGQKIDVTHICTLVSEGSGICKGDSGAPLSRNGFIIGIAAGGIKPGTQGLPDIYTNVFMYREWIMKTMEQQTTENRM